VNLRETFRSNFGYLDKKLHFARKCRYWFLRNGVRNGEKRQPPISAPFFFLLSWFFSACRAAAGGRAGEVDCMGKEIPAGPVPWGRVNV
jgi:hypothetical protein